MNAKRQLTYCSFATHDKCLGVLILEGYLNPIDAAKIAWAKKLNPGGQVLAIPCSESDSDVPPNVFEAMWENKDKLLSGPDARELFNAATIKEIDAERKAWTVGHEKNYDEAIANANEPIRKLGRNDPSEPGYEGGAVFHSPQSAQAYIINNNLPWAVYELALPNGWPLDVDASNEHIEGFARLINNATITQKVPQPGVP